jgi:hypothetical protein
MVEQILGQGEQAKNKLNFSAVHPKMACFGENRLTVFSKAVFRLAMLRSDLTLDSTLPWTDLVNWTNHGCFSAPFFSRVLFRTSIDFWYEKKSGRLARCDDFTAKFGCLFPGHKFSYPPLELPHCWWTVGGVQKKLYYTS